MTDQSNRPPFARIEVDLADLLLDRENPRLTRPENDAAAIAGLFDYKVVELAKDIVGGAGGLNPMERIGVVSDQADGGPPYVVVEGNRRVCALKMLTEPQLAPLKWRKLFENLPDYQPGRLEAIQFSDRTVAEPWIVRMHGGEQDGIGRIPWDSAAKGRKGYTDYRPAAIALHAHLVDGGYMTKEEADRKLTVLDRPIVNQNFLAATGLAYDAAVGELRGTFPEATQQAVLTELVHQIKVGRKEGGLDTRLNAEDYAEWAQRFEATLRDRGHVLEPGPARPLPLAPPRSEATDATDAAAEAGGRQGSKAETKKPKKAKKATKPSEPKVPNLRANPLVEKALDDLGLLKLRRLYHDLVSVDIARTTLVSVGIWSFLESLTSAAGRQRPQFHKFLADNINSILGHTLDSHASRDLTDALARRSDRGNATKHSATSGDMEATQLLTDWDTIEPILVPLIKYASKLREEST
jgi:hypothetical protein